MTSVITYTCAECGDTFESEHDDEARAEMERDYPGVPLEAMSVICDECYRRFEEWRETQPDLRRLNWG